MTLLYRPSIPLDKSFSALKVTFYETAQAYFSSPKYEKEFSIFS